MAILAFFHFETTLLLGLPLDSDGDFFLEFVVVADCHF
jgi:hypothetical protein